MALSGELLIRYLIPAWPFDPALYVLGYLTARDIPLRWRFSPSDGRNSLGLRNREVLRKKAGVSRILFLGDSLIWSGETSSGELYTEVLEKRLNARSSSGLGALEIVNAGIPGYTTYQGLEFLKIYGLDTESERTPTSFQPGQFSGSQGRRGPASCSTMSTTNICISRIPKNFWAEA